jgi:hypothetical protein
MSAKVQNRKENAANYRHQWGGAREVCPNRSFFLLRIYLYKVFCVDTLIVLSSFRTALRCYRYQIGTISGLSLYFWLIWWVDKSMIVGTRRSPLVAFRTPGSSGMTVSLLFLAST